VGQFARAEQGHHFRDRLAKSDPDGAGDDGVANVERMKMRDIFDILAHVGVMEAVAGVDPQAKIGGMRGGAGVARKFPEAGNGGGGIGIAAGMEFHGSGAGTMGGIDLREIGINECADAYFGRGELGNDRLKPALIRNDVKTPFRGDFLPVFRHEADFIRLEEKRLANHRRSCGHFKIKRHPNGAGKLANIGGLDVTAVLAQVDGDGLGATLLGQVRGLEDIGFGRKPPLPVTVAGFAKGRDMVDIEAEMRHKRTSVEPRERRSKKIVIAASPDLPIEPTLGHA
jgi:hypothetical protein